MMRQIIRFVCVSGICHRFVVLLIFTVCHNSFCSDVNVAVVIISVASMARAMVSCFPLQMEVRFHHNYVCTRGGIILHKSK